ALYAAAAVWVAFSGIHRDHNADSLVPSLASRYAWTPFFWEQDRVGLLVPLAASGCPDAVLNTVLQVGLTVFVGLCLPLLVAELVRPHPAARAAVTLASATMIALSPDLVRNNALFECYYPLAMCLGCAALLALGRGPGWPSWWRAGVAAGLLGLAHWVYVGVALWLGPLAVARVWAEPGGAGSWCRAAVRPVCHPRTALGVVLVVVAFLAGRELMLHAQRTDPTVHTPTPQHGLPPDRWPAAWARFAEATAGLERMTTWATVLIGAAAVGAAAGTLTAPRAAQAVAAGAGVVLLPAACEFLVLGTRDWIAQNRYHVRYLLGSLVSLQVALALLAAWPFLERPALGWRGRARFVVAAAGLFGAAVYEYGWPALDRPRQELEARTRPAWAAELEAAEVDALGGSYQSVWPVVYWVNLSRERAGNRRFLFAVSGRGVVLFRRRWDPDRPIRVAVRNDPAERDAFFHHSAGCGLEWPRKVGESGPFEVYLTAVAAPAGRAK
ncbi:MAG: hypothetical protein K2V38_00300, partial [Gemmataceae bacterium]|nr:hypothetical protein [Gemmataceae bacterium]